MELTRRDAVLALAAGVGGGAVGAELPEESVDRTGPALSEVAVETLVATAEVVFPTAVDGVPEFTEEYVDGLPAERRRLVGSTAEAFDEHARRERGRPFASLSTRTRDSVLRALGVGRVGSVPNGSLPERVRFYVVNQLLFGLYTSPTGSRLVGIENSIGNPGGYESYQRAPSE